MLSRLKFFGDQCFSFILDHVEADSAYLSQSHETFSDVEDDDDVASDPKSVYEKVGKDKKDAGRRKRKKKKRRRNKHQNKENQLNGDVKAESEKETQPNVEVEYVFRIDFRHFLFHWNYT